MSTPAETALATLREHCTPAQQATLDASQSFAAIGPSGKRYVVRLAQEAVNVNWQSALHGPWSAWVKGRSAKLPVGDLALLAKLSIESAEDTWLVAGHACGNVWVEDRDPHAMLVQQQQQAQQQGLPLGLLPVGTLYTDVFGNRYEWRGQAWVAIA